MGWRGTFILRCRCWLLACFCLSSGFLCIVLWLLDFYVSASTSFLVVSPPVVMSRGGPVGGTLHIAIVGLFVLAGSIAAPPVPAILIHLIMESVVDLGRESVQQSRQGRQSNEIFYPRSLFVLRYSISQTFLKSSIWGQLLYLVSFKKFTIIGNIW